MKPRTLKGVPGEVVWREQAEEAVEDSEYKRAQPWTEKVNVQTHRQRRTLIMQLKATYFYFTVLLSVLLANSVRGRPVGVAQRDLAERGGLAPELSGQYDSK